MGISFVIPRLALFMFLMKENTVLVTLATLMQCAIEIKARKTTKLMGFQDVAGHLMTGNPVAYFAELDACTQLSTNDEYLSKSVGGYIDLFTLINDKSVSEYPFFRTSSIQYARNSTDGLVSVLKELSVSSTEEATLKIVVSTAQGSNIVLETYTYTCQLNNSAVTFFAEETKVKELKSYKDVSNALTTGGKVRFIAEYHICRGAFEFSAGGADFKDFDVRMDGEQEVLMSTSERMISEDAGYYIEILTTKLYDNRQVVFTESINHQFDLEPQKETNFTCYLQGPQPGGSVRFYLL